MIIHHTGYGVDAANRPRGSSALPAAMDAMLSIVRPDSEALTCKMTVVKIGAMPMEWEIYKALAGSQKQQMSTLDLYKMVVAQH
jgi:hypothetical protein